VKVETLASLKLETLARRGPAAEDDPAVDARAREILARVRAEGDRALVALAKELDKVELAAIRVPDDEMKAALGRIPKTVARALTVAERRVSTFARRQRRALHEFSVTRGGVTLGQRVVPIARAGVYVPGGRYPLPSTAIMGVACARAAGVAEVAAITPPGPDGKPSDVVLAACRVAGATDVYVSGGAQAIAALAYGTETVRPVDVVVGPGNVFVQAAKRLVAGRVGIDLPAGPSEALVVLAPDGDVDLAAWDLVSQCEHDPRARAWLVTWSRATADAVATRCHELVADLPTRKVAEESLEHALAVVVANEAEAVLVADAVAPEHLAVHARDPRRLAGRFRRFGALFLGDLSAIPLGDFVLGPNHTLPTGGSARFASGLSPLHFVTVRPFSCVQPRGFAKLEGAARALASAEGLAGHERALAARRAKKHRSP
jgi:histidinol dehydrogenase